MRPATEIIRGIRQTEKGTRVATHNQYVLNVALDANKAEIRGAIEQLFQVKVLKVNTQVRHGKWRRLGQRVGRRSDWKNAVVTVAKGQKIEMKS